MNPRRFGLVFGRDFSHDMRRALFWIWVALLVFLAWSFSTGKVRIQSGDSAVGGTKAYITSEFAVAQQLIVFTCLVYGFFVSVAAGMTVIQDDECQVGELLHATSLRPGEYIWGKFLAVLAASAVVLAIHALATVLFNHGLYSGETKEFRGPLALANYIKPALVFSMPTIIFFAGVSFYVGERTRRPVLIFFLPVAVLLGCVFFLWDWAPSWLDPRINQFLMLIDPAGFRWLNETYLKVDRGVAYYNAAPVPLDPLIVANRLIVATIGLGAVALSRRHFAATLRGASPKAKEAWKAGRRARGERGTPVGNQVPGVSTPLSTLGMSSRRPGLLTGTWSVFRAEIVELLSSPGLYLFVPLLVLEAIGPNLIAVGAFDTLLLLTPGTFAARSMNALSTLVCLLMLFYIVESLWRERHTRLEAISLATPVRTGSILLGKVLSNSLVGIVVVLLTFLVACGFFLYQGKVGIAVVPFALVWGLLLVPTFLLWTSFVMATLSLTRNRYTTYAIALAVLAFTGYRQIIGEINWVGNWPIWSVLQWSDMSILEFDRTALALNRLMALGLTLVFLILTLRLHPRRDVDANAMVQRLRPGMLLRQALWLAPALAIPLAAGGILWSWVDVGFQGKASKKLMKDYWRKNLATYLDAPVPDITAVDITVDLDPGRSRLKVEGTYDLVNNRDKALKEIPVTGGMHWESPEWTFDGKPVTPTNRSGLYIFTPEAPLASCGKARLGFRFSGTFPGGITKKGGGNNEFILPSGVVLTSFGTSFAPTLGFMEAVGVDDENKYETKEYPDDYYKGQTESFAGSRRPFKTRVKVTGPDSLEYNSVGTRTSEVVANGRRTVVWESDQPVNFYNIVAGRWEVRKGNGTAVYYHKGHPYNIGEMVEALDAARTYYSEWFWPYPWRELKLSEFPALASYAQGFPTDITFSESIGFLTESSPKANAAFMVTAHEAAHQWWGNLIAPGKGPGGNLLSEGTSHFSTMLLFEQVKGMRDRIGFALKIEDSYAKARSADSERPLVKIDGSRDGDQTVTYDKTGWVLWMLMQHMGRAPMLAGIREFFATYRENPDHPVLQDFLAVLRKHAPNPGAFDAFTDQWFFHVVVPEYEVIDAKKVRDGSSWLITARVKNIGTGTMPIEVAATRGERFPKDGSGSEPNPDYRDARHTMTLGPNASDTVTIGCDFEPNKVVIDPDVNVLMLRRKAAFATP
jgi:ABC-type Na+ efflux pump permease subunit